ncbi:MAG: adenylyltransferase/cytidyltransferase family protein [Gemmatimonadetes bacterium]|nr:adenylyltransferase/cytidyltransferase family protein [Gemmatimonadota bacterium]
MPKHKRNAARIVDLEEFPGLGSREDLGAIVATSGGYDPLHPGHVSCLLESSAHGDTLVVIVNGDGFLRRKKGKPFMDLRARCQVVSCIRGVDFVIPFEIEDDDTVCEALRVIRPRVFTKGGDRTGMSNIPEWSVCKELGIEVISGVGLDKAWSSSDYLESWGRFWSGRADRG